MFSISILSYNFQTLFGSLSILAGFSVLMFPETNGIQFINDLDQAEAFYQKNISLICRRKTSQDSKLM